jgi:hypothetical protein
MSTKESLEREYQHKAAQAKADEALSWEKKMLSIRRLRTEYDRKIREVEEEGTAA